MRWSGHRGGFWLNYGICPDCGEKHPPRVGAITCHNCGKTFDNKGLEMRPPRTAKGWGKAIYGGILVGIGVVCLSVLLDWFL